MAFDFISEQLSNRVNDGLYRHCTAITGSQGRLLNVDNKNYLNFSSNDYLGLASDPALINAWQKGAQLFGVGSGGSFLVTGYNKAHEDLTEQLKSWLGVEALALFSSGYSANQAIIKLLLGKNDLLIQDKLNHASLMEAGTLADCKMLRFKHNDVSHLEQSLIKHGSNNANKLIISEGVFSMDGDCAPIRSLADQANLYDSWLMIDDAHGLGVLGKNGQGSAVHAGLKNSDLQIYMGTFGKALGVGGAFVAGSQAFIDYLTNFSKPYIYSTGLPPAMAYTISQAAKMVENEHWRRDKLHSLINTFRRIAAEQGIQIAHSSTAIQPIIIGDSKKAVRLAEQLKILGFWTTAIRPPTVPVNSARLRITLTAHHKIEDLQRLVAAIRRVLNEL
ncbi:8-amino-7-oxononanoate synthase [Psychromonas antarctica]|jgi:8-amino-7-oxononanoate synthase|uniref:8-amino-7-oxononanoate synthase n=1 Tax=Psychromonas antarctica TaxID=67573 RepID=UPI001EE8F6D8|nr:8-amino-7-oxononanoate synthase [Psychromonas antarctica]MCG6200617.1 8-amino-7-oxononanoate synthase [Psychromonas antarctica]